MNVANFKHLLNSHAPVSLNEAEELAELLQKYPYLQSARTLQLKGFKNNFDSRYNQALKTTAAFTTDRSVLFDFITSNDFVVFIQKDNIAEKVVNLKKNDESINTNEKPVSNIDDEETFNQSIEIKTAETKLEIGKPLTFGVSDTFSFNEWLQLSTVKPIKREENTANSTSKKEHQSSIIENFINSNPKIKSPDKNSPIKDIAVSPISPSENLMTETLARVYLEQKKYDNAIKAYKILSLKYPEKSGYFADQIKAIIKIQNNNIS